MDILTRVKDILEDMSTADLVSIHNEYCDKNNYMDDYIYSMHEFDDILSGRTPSEVLNDIGEPFDINDNYFVFDVYGIKSFDYADDDASPIYISDIARYIVNNGDDLDNDDIREALDAEEEDPEGIETDLEGVSVWETIN